MYGNNWIEQFIPEKLSNSCNPYLTSYFKWRFETNTTTYAHIFFLDMDKERDLVENWESITRSIAYHIQSEIKPELELSNFYLCFFVKEKVSAIEIATVENDSYSSKKIVVPESGYHDIRERLQYIQHKIFDFAFAIPKIDAPYIERISLQNFRSYKGLCEIKLTNSVNKPIKLTLLYAPNGTGKTAIFDAVEWNLTGEVERLSNIVPNTEAIIKNLDTKPSDSVSVTLLFSDNNYIRALIPSEERQKQIVDAYMPLDSLKRSYYLTSDKRPDKDRNLPLWSGNILSHDKIDNFIAAGNPEEWYLEWSKIWDSHDEYMTRFENLKREEIELQQKVNELISENKDLLNKQNHLRNQEIIASSKQELLQNIESDLCQLFSTTGTPDIKIDFLNATLKEYQEFSDTVKKYHDCLNSRKNSIKRQQQYLANSYKKDVAYYQEVDEERLLNIQKLADITEQLNIINEREAIDRDIERLNSTIEQDENVFLNKNSIVERGAEWFLELKEFTKQNIQRLKSAEKSDVISNEIRDIKTAISRNGKQQELVRSEIKKREEEIKEIVRESRMPNVETLNEMQKLYSLMQEIFSTNDFPKYNDIFWQIEQYSNSEDIKSIIHNLKNELDNFQNETSMLESFQHILDEQEDTSKKIFEIKRQSQEVIDSNHLNVCPVCGSAFQSYKDLLNATYKELSGFYNIIQNQSFNLVRIHEQSSGNIVNLCNQFLKLYRTQISTLEQQLNDISAYDLKFQSLAEEKRTLMLTKQEKEKIYNFLETEIKAMNNMATIYVDKLELASYKSVIYYGYSIANYDSYEELYQDCELLKEKIDIAKREIENKRKIIADRNIVNHSKMEYENTSRYLEKTINNQLVMLWQLRENMLTNLPDINEDEILNAVAIFEHLKDMEDKYRHLENLENDLYTLQYNQELATYYEYREDNKKKLKINASELDITSGRLEKKREELREHINKMDSAIQLFFQQNHLMDIYKKLDPHQTFHSLIPAFSFNKNNKPCLQFQVVGDDEQSFSPLCFFSASQLNIVAFSLFIGKALLSPDLPCKCIMVDDPIGHFDDMNILNFIDLLRTIIEKTDRQLIISTHDDRIYHLMQRKLPATEYPVQYKDCRDIIKEGKYFPAE